LRPTSAAHFSSRRLADAAKLHFLPVADFLTGYAIDRRSYAVKDDDRTLCVLQDRPIFLIELFAGFKVEIFAGLAAPIDLALTVVIAFTRRFRRPNSASASCSFSLA
jgi:hypothetical protein